MTIQSNTAFDDEVLNAWSNDLARQSLYDALTAKRAELRALADQLHAREDGILADIKRARGISERTDFEDIINEMRAGEY